MRPAVFIVSVCNGVDMREYDACASEPVEFSTVVFGVVVGLFVGLFLLHSATTTESFGLSCVF